MDAADDPIPAGWPTPAVMSSRTNGEIPEDHPGLARELEAAIAAVRDYCRWHVAGVEQRTLTRLTPFVDMVWIPAMEIKSIDALTLGGVVQDRPGDLPFDPTTGYTGIMARSYSITYTSGFEKLPAAIETLVLELAAGGLGTAVGIDREQAGGVSVSFARAGGGLNVGPGGADAATLAPYRLGVLP